MVNPRTGRVNQEWIVESITSEAYAAGAVALFSSAHHPVVSEAYLLHGTTNDHGTVVVAPGTLVATVIAHDSTDPAAATGTISATQVATVGPQQFLVAGLAGTQATGMFYIRGR
jgi:hypothetical protein